jgi:hypothetical protein
LLVEDGKVVTYVVDIIGLLGANVTVVLLGFLFKMFGVAGLCSVVVDPAGTKVIKRVFLSFMAMPLVGDSTLTLTNAVPDAANFFVNGGVVE